ncbi:Arginine N-methyltransferase 2 [Microbotryomycetes sp. JL221]|nr:Arginine N-methyltransferase 2 [Microbotryomycetes sp. JL221]
MSLNDTHDEPIPSTSADSNDVDMMPQDDQDSAIQARIDFAMQLIQACLDANMDKVQVLVEEVGAHCWIQDQQGWTSLHAAAYTGNTELVKYLLRTGNAAWQITDNLGFTAGDIAYSMNEAETYDFLLQEGIRAELLRSAIESNQSPRDHIDKHDDDNNDNNDMTDLQQVTAPQKTTATDNETFLHSKLKFVKDQSGQEVAIDEQGVGVMMGWERPIMQQTADLLCQSHASRKGKNRAQLDEHEFNVINVGFGLGIIDECLQTYNPTTHLIIEPHPDVLKYAESKGFMSKPGIKFFKGTWQQYLEALEKGDEHYIQFDVIYFDTYSEHYKDLHQFFDSLPNLLRDETSLFSFFHGLGARSRHLYDIYTTVSEIHLKETGLSTEWSQVEIGQIEWQAAPEKYWQSIVGPYRLPLSKLDF